jgi:hypothetical protein
MEMVGFTVDAEISIGDSTARPDFYLFEKILFYFSIAPNGCTTGTHGVSRAELVIHMKASMRPQFAKQLKKQELNQS